MQPFHRPNAPPHARDPSTYDAVMRLTARIAGSLLMAVVILSPVLREPTDDTYPLSTYPMFASDRGAQHAIATVVEIDVDGTALRLSPRLIAGTDEVILASVTVKRSVAQGESDLLCAEIANRLGPGRTVEVRVETVDVVKLVTNGVEPSRVDVRARCVA